MSWAPIHEPRGSGRGRRSETLSHHRKSETGAIPWQSRGLTDGLSFVAVKRRLTQLVACLFLGAIVNVTVAWGCAVSIVVGPKTSFKEWVPLETERTSTTAWAVQRWRRQGAYRIISSWDGNSSGLPGDLPYVRPLPAWSLPQQTIKAGDVRYSLMDARGWPALAMCSAVAQDYTGVSGEDFPETAFVSGLRISGGDRPFTCFRENEFLPLRPIWPGFAINTVFYAVILWVLTFGPFAMRRVIRRKYGRCIRCGYDLRGKISIGCPECGWRREAEA